ncbi:hypothetical protein LCGC14_1843780 [marine sediment metagenome]|uniref:DNA methylase N-4/N-6 domain-containing protein n=1 Tax=marine sediment metagenome TaxID=412755 RepID=A0A0F9H0P2_9ZZZZ
MASGCPPCRVRIERHHAQPNRWTFTIPPIAALIAEEGVGEGWIDPFAGMHSPAEHRNDINVDMFADEHMDAREWLRFMDSEQFAGAIYDPPYSYRQAVEMYGERKLPKNYTTFEYWAQCRDELARLIKPGGKAICCGWNSVGLGKSRGFHMERVLLVPHGGGRNDTIVTVEMKIQGRLL